MGEVDQTPVKGITLRNQLRAVVVLAVAFAGRSGARPDRRKHARSQAVPDVGGLRGSG